MQPLGLDKILIIGKHGQIASSLGFNLNDSRFDTIFSSSSDIDIRNKNQIYELVARIEPDFIINCAAFTDVDKAELNKLDAKEINSDALLHLSEICKIMNIHLIHFSTDYVFDGLSSNPYKENDKTNPVNFYGKTKLSGEKTIFDSGCFHSIIRTSWVYSDVSKNFLLTILNKAKNEHVLNVVNDQFGCPTSSYEIATMIKMLLINLQTNFQSTQTLHFSGCEQTSWYNFAKKIISSARAYDPIFDKVMVKPISTQSLNQSARRPIKSTLDCQNIANKIGFTWKPLVHNIEFVLNKVFSEK